ncbi:MAG: phenylalanine--tRNA ligase subunit beta [Hydrogenoanaerobacterium sp.]
MNLSMKWLADYVSLDKNMSSRAFCEAMTMSGSKVEGYKNEADGIKNIVVGKVLSVTQHPDAEKLVICMINVGKDEPVQIVTGASNVNEGDMVPVCLDGAVLPDGKIIKKGKLRGVLSNGMLCSLSELGLTEHDFPYAIEDGIFILQEPCEIGQDICSAIGLDDTCVEFEITPNRPDCLSMLGLAREASVTFNTPLLLSEKKPVHECDSINDILTVEVKNAELCPRYVAKAVKNIKVAPSPRWMRERLRACGVRPINNIVDITNYVMLEYGQPMHAFDHSFVKGKKITVRNAYEGEEIVTLDDVTRKLTPEMLVIADAEAPSAVAGVMGGEFSSITDKTNTIIFESACFKGSSVRTTSKKLGLRTEASGRFEKGLDPETCVPAVLRACQLVEELAAGEVLEGIIDVNNSTKTPTEIPLEASWINRFLGIELEHGKMLDILTSLGCTVDKNDIVTIPSFRGDLQHKADLAEEIARIYGYDKIPATAIRGTAQAELTSLQRFEQKISATLLAQGCYEIMTYSFISPKYYDKIALPTNSPLRNSVVISNPLGEDTSVMRTSAVPSMLEVLARNYNNRNATARLFEIATEYVPTAPDKLPDENQKIVLGCYGENIDYYELKGITETLLATLGGYDYDIIPEKENPSFHPGRCAKLMLGNDVLGFLGEIHPTVLENYQIGTRAYIAELDEAMLFAHRAPEKAYKPLPKFPATTRDIAVLCDENLPVLTLYKAIKEAAGRQLAALELFDVYRGAQVPQGKKSVAYNILLRAQDKTLTDEDANAVMKRVLKAITALGAELRS